LETRKYKNDIQNENEYLTNIRLGYMTFSSYIPIT